jgi:hypothetical protein
MVAHDYQRRVCRADFTTTQGGEDSWTAKRRAADATLTTAAPS